MKKFLSLLSLLFVFFIFSPLTKVLALQPPIIKVKTYDNVVIKLKEAIKNTEPNLSDIIVAYDTKGEYKIDYVTIKKQDKNTLIIIPPPHGWEPKMNYYILVNKKTKGKSNKNSKEIINKFTVSELETKILKGKLKLPNNEIANEDIDVYIDIFNTDDDSITTKVIIPKGKNTIDYSIKFIAKKKSYSIGYKLYNHNCPSYLDNGYLSNNGMVSTIKDKKSFSITNNLNLDLTLLYNKTALKMTQEILDSIIKDDMSDFEKETAIYNYVRDNFKYDFDLYKKVMDAHNVVPDDIYKSHDMNYIFTNKKTICLGYARVMKLLLNMVNIECYVAYGNSETDQSGHAWNVVKLSNNYYPVDVLMDCGKYLSKGNLGLNSIEDSHTVFFNCNMQNNPYPNFNSFEYDYKFNKYCKNNNLKLNDITKIKGTVSLPNGEKAPKGGTIVSLQALTCNDTKDINDDFKNEIYLLIPEGSNSIDYSISVVPTNDPYNILVSDSCNLYDYKTVILNNLANLEVDLKLKKLNSIKGKISLPQNSKFLTSNMKIFIFAKLDNKIPNRTLSDVVFVTSVNIEEEKTTSEFSIPVMPSDKPYILSYEIINEEDFKDYVKTAYYNINTSTEDYNSSTKIYINKDSISPSIYIIKK